MEDIGSLFGKESVSNDERRRGGRVKPEGVEVRLVSGDDVLVRDLSVKGIALETSARLELNRLYPIKITRAERDVTVPGRVVWCRLATMRKTANGEMRPLYCAGMSFDEEHAKSILRLFYPHFPSA